MNFELISASVFLLIVTMFSIINRKKFKIQGWFPIAYNALYRTKLGIKQMDAIANKFPRFWKYFSYACSIIGFLGMAFVTILIAYSIYHQIVILLKPHIQAAVQGVTLVLPFAIKGTFYVPFSFWILSIIIIVSMHEMMHGIIARHHKIKIKSSGFAFLSILLPLIPAAFVEPDEKELAKKKPTQRFSMLAAGGVINVLFALILLFIIPFANSVANSFVNYDGAVVDGIFAQSQTSNLAKGDRIIAIGDAKAPGTGGTYYTINTLQDLYDAMGHYKAGDTVNIFVQADNSSNVNVDPALLQQDPYNSGRPFLGITVHQSADVKSDHPILGNIMLWLQKLIFWLYVLSLGIGLMNLAPMLPFDGGQMFLILMEKIFKKKEHANKAAGITTLIMGILIVGGIVIGFL